MIMTEYNKLLSYVFDAYKIILVYFCTSSVVWYDKITFLKQLFILFSNNL